MLPLRLHVLGVGAARPFPDVYTSAVYLTRGGSSVLVDCGEGILTQLPPRALGQRGLDAVCITHLHGDHVYGLPGLLSSMTLGGRTRALDLLGPPALREYVASVFAFTQASCSFDLRYVVLPQGPSPAPVLVLRDLVVYSLPLRHRVEAFGFCVSSPPQLRRLRPGVVQDYSIPYYRIDAIRRGADFHGPDTIVPNADLTLEAHARQTVAYFTDTAPLDAWPVGWPAVDVLLHDATFAPVDAELAAVSGHSTTLQAAAFAKTIGAQTFLLTHRSVRYGPEAAEALADEANEYVKLGNPNARTLARWAVQGEVIEL